MTADGLALLMKFTNFLFVRIVGELISKGSNQASNQALYGTIIKLHSINRLTLNKHLQTTTRGYK